MRNLIKVIVLFLPLCFLGCGERGGDEPINDTLNSVSSVSVLADQVVMSVNATATFDFALLPWTVEPVCDVNSQSFPFALAVADSAPAKGAKFEQPDKFGLTSVYKVFDSNGNAVKGQYRACITDLGTDEPFQTKCSLVVHRNGQVVCASQPFVVSSAKTSELLLSFGFESYVNNGVKSFDCTIDMDNMTLKGTSRNLIDLGSLVATFVVEQGVKVYVGSQEQISGKSVNDFTKSVVYRFVSPSGTEEQYTVLLTNFTGLPVVTINTDAGKGIYDRETWVDATFSISGLGDEFEAVENVPVGIRGRGNATWSYPKKPYALKFESRTSIAGMPKHKRWVLLANWMDKTILRNWASFEAASMTSMAWTPHSVFVELVLNGRHVGNYQLCEQIRVDKNRVAIDEMTVDDKSGNNLTGGYLLELDSYYDETNKFRSSVKNLPFMIKEPDVDVLNTEQFGYIYSYVNNLEQLLSSSSMAKDGKYKELIDVDSFIDWWLVHELVGNWEPKHPKSCYMYKVRGGKLYAGPVWDFDWGTFRNNQDYTTLNLTNTLWYGMLFKDPAFVAQAKVRWSKLKPMFEKLPGMIADKYASIEDSAKTNEQMWPLANQSGVNLDEKLSVGEAVALMQRLLTKRITTMDYLIKQL